MPTNNFQITQGSGTTVAAEQGTGLEFYQKIKLIDPTPGSTSGIGTVSNPERIDPTGTTPQPVTGTFWQATQPVSGTFWQATQPVSGTIAATQSGAWIIQETSANLAVSATAATGVAVTATLPAVSGQFHYISFIEILKYFTVANAASATPLVCTTTNLPGSLAFCFGQPLGAIGVTDRMIHLIDAPLKSSVVNTATTIVCPATTGIIWRVNVYYFAAP